MPISRSDGRICDKLKNMEIHTENEARGIGRDEKKTQAGRAAEVAEAIGSDEARKRQMDSARVLQHQVKVSRRERSRTDVRERNPFVLQKDSVDPVEVQRKMEANGKSNGDDDEKIDVQGGRRLEH